MKTGTSLKAAPIPAHIPEAADLPRLQDTWASRIRSAVIPSTLRVTSMSVGAAIHRECRPLLRRSRLMIQTAATICTAALTSAIPSRDGATARSARYRTWASTGYSKGVPAGVPHPDRGNIARLRGQNHEDDPTRQVSNASRS